MITLTLATTQIQLSDRLFWTDEYAWGPVVTETRWGTNGALHVHVGARQAGRPITLDGKSSAAWTSRAQCDQLRAWSALPGATFELVLRGAARTVLLLEFQADPVWRRLLDGEHTPEVQYLPFFRFLEV